MLAPDAIHLSTDLEGLDRALHRGAGLYALGTVLHTADHVRRGSDVLTAASRALGGGLTILAIVAIVVILARRHYAPAAALGIGATHAFWIIAGHLAPRWNSFSDTFPGAAATNGVTGFSWVTAVLELAGAVAVAVIGARLLRRQRALRTTGAQPC